MSTLEENVAKVENAYRDLKEAISSKGVDITGAKLSDMPSLVEKIVVTSTQRPVLPKGFCKNAVVMADLFNGCAQMVSLELPSGSGAVVEDASSMFHNCTGLSSLTIPDGFGSAITDASYMFYNCDSLSSLTVPDGFGSAITDASYMFKSCNDHDGAWLTNLLVAGFGTSIVKAESMFSYFSGSWGNTVHTLPDGFGSEIVDATRMFSYCMADFAFPEGFCGKLEVADKMFSGYYGSITSITLPVGFGTLITSAREMFHNLQYEISLPLSDIINFGEKITDAEGMFSESTRLIRIYLPAGFGGNIENARDMFSGDYNLEILSLPVGFGSCITDASNMFYLCSSLTQILAPDGVVLEDDGSNGILRMKTSFGLSSTALDKESLIRVIKSLQTVTSATLTLGTTLKAKLEGDDNADGAAALALATSKGWTIA